MGGRLLHAAAMRVQHCRQAAIDMYFDNDDGMIVTTAQSAGTLLSNSAAQVSKDPGHHIES